MLGACLEAADYTYCPLILEHLRLLLAAHRLAKFLPLKANIWTIPCGAQGWRNMILIKSSVFEKQKISFEHYYKEASINLESDNKKNQTRGGC